MNVLTDILMNPADELLWEQDGFFDKVDSLNKRPPSLFSNPPVLSFPAETHPAPDLHSRFLDGAQRDRDRPPLVPSTGLDSNKVSTHTDRAPIRRKVWKASKHTKRLVLGDGVGLEDLCKMSTSALVGRISYKSLSRQPLEDWIQSSWLPLLGYAPEVLFLKKGGFVSSASHRMMLLCYFPPSGPTGVAALC
jgi:hypothetical protein